MNFQNVIHQLEQEKARRESAISALRKLSEGKDGASRSAVPYRNSAPAQARRGSRLTPGGAQENRAGAAGSVGQAEAE